MADNTDFDVAIIGGGPAGLSAGLWLARYLRSVVIIDSGDPRNWETRGINGIIGQQGIKPAELRGKGRDDCRKFGAVLIDGEVTKTGTTKDLFTVELKDGRKDITAKRLLLAIGIKDVWPDVPGLGKCYGETAYVCPDCDGYEARDKKTVVIGTSRKAVGMALALITWTREIVICTNGEKADMTQELMNKLDRFNIPVLEAKIKQIDNTTTGKSHTMSLEGGMQLNWERIFFAIGQYPSDDLGAQLGCKRDNIGRIIVDEHHHTSVNNVYAAGDITHSTQLAIAAAAAGAVAAVAIHNSLKPDELKID